MAGPSTQPELNAKSGDRYHEPASQSLLSLTVSVDEHAIAALQSLLDGLNPASGISFRSLWQRQCGSGEHALTLDELVILATGKQLLGVLVARVAGEDPQRLRRLFAGRADGVADHLALSARAADHEDDLLVRMIHAGAAEVR